jgi:hypothetical protein
MVFTKTTLSSSVNPVIICPNLPLLFRDIIPFLNSEKYQEAVRRNTAIP